MICHPLGIATKGSVKSLTRQTPGTAMHEYQRAYHCSNMIIVLKISFQ